MRKYGLSQSGAALIVALIVLLLLTLLGTSGIRRSMLDLYLTKGFRDQDHALQSAETGLRLAEQIIENAATEADISADLGKRKITYHAASGGNNIVAFIPNKYVLKDGTEVNWADRTFISDDFQVKVIVEPWVFVPDSAAVGTGNRRGKFYYRITARGADPSYEDYVTTNSAEDETKGRAVVILQSIYAVRTQR